MSHEIYYTSAPEGMKRGTSGFCTVAASDNIPKALWDRLETLSAYRHQYGAGGLPNPVSFAHWILNIAGKTHHVLSRICDSGVDHTQRTNAFAHHLVLEPAEIAAALGGPAWLLDQPGVMMDRWNGQVGALVPSRLAAGDSLSSSRVCRAWAAATGDAGWGGHLADVFAKSPTRPVCILFGPEQEMLPLIAEAIALLPPAARWNVTFNTYFTSMPTSATCLWRCCLAGTQAAQIGLRYASNGLVLDLTDRARLPALPAGMYVTMARTGQAAEAPRAAAAKPAQPTLAELKNRATGGTAKPPRPGPVYDLEAEIEARQTEERNRLLSDFDKLVDQSSPEAAAAPDMDLATGGDSTYDLREQETPVVSVPTGRRMGAGGRPLPGRIMRRAEEALEDAEREAAQAAQRRRKQVLLLFAGALGAIAVGCALIYFASQSTAPPEIPGGGGYSTTRTRPVETRPPATYVATQEVPATVSMTQTMPATTLAAQTKPAATATAPELVQPAIIYPETLALTTPLERPNVGTGIGDRTQSLGFRAADLDPMPVTGMRLAFFAAQAAKLNPAGAATGPAQTSYSNITLGTLTAVPGANGLKKGVSLYWKQAGDPGLGVEMAFVGFDRTKPGVEIVWHSAALLRNSGVFNFMFWTLQNSAFVLDSGRTAKQHVVMKPVAPLPVDFSDPAFSAFNLSWPDLPKDVRAVEPAAASLPLGWKADWYLDWDKSITATTRTPDNANQVIKFTKPTNKPKLDAWFLLTFKPGSGGGIASVDNTFAKEFQQAQIDLDKAEKDLADINKKITDITNDPALKAFGGGVPGELTNQQADALLTVDAYKAAVAGYNELDKFDVSFDLSDNMRLATLHFQRAKALQLGN